jgi:hypothetical protein
MGEANYEGLNTGERWGCAVSGLGAVCLMFLLSVDALGDCAPDTRCSKGFWTNVLLPTVAITTLAFFTVRAVVNSRRR